MFELADRLVGIYKTHDATKSITINPKMFLDVITDDESTTANTASTNEVTKVVNKPIRKVLGDATNTHMSK